MATAVLIALIGSVAEAACLNPKQGFSNQIAPDFIKITVSGFGAGKANKIKIGAQKWKTKTGCLEMNTDGAGNSTGIPKFPVVTTNPPANTTFGQLDFVATDGWSSDGGIHCASKLGNTVRIYKHARMEDGTQVYCRDPNMLVDIAMHEVGHKLGFHDSDCQGWGMMELRFKKISSGVYRYEGRELNDLECDTAETQNNTNSERKATEQTNAGFGNAGPSNDLEDWADYFNGIPDGSFDAQCTSFVIDGQTSVGFCFIVNEY